MCTYLYGRNHRNSQATKQTTPSSLNSSCFKTIEYSPHLIYNAYIYTAPTGEQKMKLIGNLKKQVEETKNKEEAKEVIEKAGMELTDEELDQVTGGVKGRFDINGHA